MARLGKKNEPASEILQGVAEHAADQWAVSAHALHDYLELLRREDLTHVEQSAMVRGLSDAAEDAHGLESLWRPS
ncbi:hypothetical protein SAMN04488563_5442 [Jiangella alkaliphila]|uniref:Uncharacterized protein n=2 Tax=Jiangella alkaliphila TaxID=419479 RepID=A0A1H2L7Y8_9ACTN|nr:hypothetical protein SAMN04488563_5442 [Jiangella alkaliphila]